MTSACDGEDTHVCMCMPVCACVCTCVWQQEAGEWRLSLPACFFGWRGQSEPAPVTAKSHKVWSRPVGAQKLVWALTLCNTPGVRGERGLEVHRLIVTPVGCQLSGAGAVSSVLLHFWHVLYLPCWPWPGTAVRGSRLDFPSLEVRSWAGRTPLQDPLTTQLSPVYEAAWCSSWACP